MLELPLNNSPLKVILDDEDLPLIKSIKLYINKHSGQVQLNCPRTKITKSLGRFLLSPEDRYILVDHINRNKLDNRRVNLRLASTSQNKANGDKFKIPCTSKYKGVTKEQGRDRWRSNVYFKNKKFEGGTFKTEIEAAIATNILLKEIHGEFANLNKIE